MNTDISDLISEIERINTGEPWFGRCAYDLLENADSSKVFTKPGNTGHSMIELLYHMNTWAGFTLKRIERDDKYDLKEFEKIDWRQIDPDKHSWKDAVAEYKQTHERIIKLLKNKEDSFLEEKVDFRKYNFRFLLNGIIQHDIYHLGQIAYISKFRW
jgi:uncharacterized damage-inducible protein DinB